MPREPHRHADDEVLEQYSMGSLPEPELGELEEHLLICSQCQDRLARTDAYVRGMQGAARRIRQKKNGETPV